MEIYTKDVTILLKLNDNIDKNILKKYDISVNEAETYIENFVKSSDELWERITHIGEAISTEEKEILLTKKYIIKFDDEEKGYEHVSNLFAPAFNAESFCISDISFFIGKDNAYLVKVDYDFENVLELTINKLIDEPQQGKAFIEGADSIIDCILESMKEI